MSVEFFLKGIMLADGREHAEGFGRQKQKRSEVRDNQVTSASELEGLTASKGQKESTGRVESVHGSPSSCVVDAVRGAGPLCIPLP